MRYKIPRKSNYSDNPGILHPVGHRSLLGDPSAGSPTETLLRLLLPLDDIARRRSETLHPWSIPPSYHPTHWQERRAVCTKGGTKSARADDSRLLGIPRSRSTITMIYPHHDAHYKRIQASRLSKPRCVHHCSARAAQNI